MKRIFLTLIIIVQATLSFAQIYIGESDIIPLPISNEAVNGSLNPIVFFRHYIKNNDNYTTLNISLLNEDVNVEGVNNVIIEYSDNTSETIGVYSREESDPNCIEFRVNHNNICTKTILLLIVQGENNYKQIYSITNGKSTELLETFRVCIDKAKIEARKNKRNSIDIDSYKTGKVRNDDSKEVRSRENFGIGISSGVTSIAKEGVFCLSYGAYISLFNFYADFRIMPTLAQAIDNIEVKARLYQFNAGYRINIYKGFGITPLIGMTQYRYISKQDDNKETILDYDKKYVNYGIMFDHIYFNLAKTFGIKTGVVVQRHNFGITFGAVYNW